LLFFFGIEPTGLRPFFRVFVGSEKHVPPSDIAVIVFVSCVLMMYPMQINSTRMVHVFTSGSFQPGIERSRMKQPKNINNINGSIKAPYCAAGNGLHHCLRKRL
jgi:hypothetical protein